MGVYVSQDSELGYFPSRHGIDAFGSSDAAMVTACKNGEVHLWRRGEGGYQPLLLFDVRRNLVGAIATLPPLVAASLRVEKLWLSACTNHLVIQFNNNGTWYLSLAGVLSDKIIPGTTLNLVCEKKGVSCLAWTGPASPFSASLLLGTVDGQVLDVVIDHGVAGQTDVWELFAAREWSLPLSRGAPYRANVTVRTAWNGAGSRPHSSDGVYGILQDLTKQKFTDSIFRKQLPEKVRPIVDIGVRCVVEGLVVAVADEVSVTVFAGTSAFVAFARPHRQFRFDAVTSVSFLALEKQWPLNTHLVQAQRECNAEFGGRVQESSDNHSLWNSIEKHVGRF